MEIQSITEVLLGTKSLCTCCEIEQYFSNPISKSAEIGQLSGAKWIVSVLSMCKPMQFEGPTHHVFTGRSC